MDKTLAELIFCIQFIVTSFPKGIFFFFCDLEKLWIVQAGIVYLILFMKDLNFLGFTLKVLVHLKAASFQL